ncbi:MAG: hypothetical protein CVU62_03915 [Deltaproteobacteria bacterium HGW-Deltaproteobacteria-2]|jgi:hypothetical protein|nr:MAG: hypothetical protein CVU62_03915 [Deltaproteobacteria bacterium HGW-Deltaproteobacteria-2]
MFTKNNGNQLKIEDIRLSPELLRINSRFTGGGGLAKILLILIVALPLIFYKDIIHIIKDKSPDEQLVLTAMAVFFLAAFFFTLYKMTQNSGKVLIVTEKGFFIEPGLAEFWKDIDEYRWNVPSAANKDLFSGQNEGTSLLFFNNKGAWPKTFDLMQYNIFFTPDQMQQVDTICNRMGIKRSES